MIDRVLVANRGEIAVRLIRACHRLGRQAVVAHSEPDAGSMAVALADDAVALTGSAAAETYLDGDQILAAAIASGCDAVHPGYGFLAERADFAHAVTAASLTWIGPPGDVIARMGDKLAARRVALEAGVPLVPGATVAVEDAEGITAIGQSVGWPLAVKAVHGGGGRGMRVIADADEVHEMLAAAQRESQSSFGRAEVYIERFLPRPRHVEVQILADHHGRVVAVGDRDCSIQRRYQKLIEEAPAPNLPDTMHTRLADAAVRLARSVGYTNAGTVEFLVSDGEMFFLEMNTRIQVEHPVTEEVTGLDLVAEQIRIAEGQPLSIGTDGVAPRGAAIEIRINAEEVAGGAFLPAPGTLHRFQPPTGPGVRVDTGFRSGDHLPSAYDNLLAKIVVWGSDRDDARRRAIEALGELVVDGVPTTAPAAAAVLAHEDFRAGRHSTVWLAESAAELFPVVDHADDGDGLEAVPTAEPNPPAEVELLGRWYRIPLFDETAGDVAGDGGSTATDRGGPPKSRSAPGTRRTGGTGRITAPMQGTVTAVAVGIGENVEPTTPVVILEAMKMENTLVAGVAGTVTAVHVAAGTNVAPGTLLVEVDGR